MTSPTRFSGNRRLDNDQSLERGQRQRRDRRILVGLREVTSAARHRQQAVEAAPFDELEQQLTAGGGDLVGAQAAAKDQVRSRGC